LDPRVTNITSGGHKQKGLNLLFFNFLTSGNEDTGIRFVDINSDGLIDVLEGIHTTKKVHLNTGSSWGRFGWKCLGNVPC
jgi:hypothetical protein